MKAFKFSKFLKMNNIVLTRGGGICKHQLFFLRCFIQNSVMPIDAGAETACVDEISADKMFKTS